MPEHTPQVNDVDPYHYIGVSKKTKGYDIHCEHLLHTSSSNDFKEAPPGDTYGNGDGL